MARRGRPPQTKSITDLDADVLTSIREAVLSHADESYTAIHRRFGLHQRGVTYATFRRWAKRLREREQSERIANAAPTVHDQAEEAELVQRLRRKVLVSAIEALESGDSKLYEMASVFSRVLEYDRTQMQRQAEKRAEELHALKLDEVHSSLRAEVETQTAGGKTLSREEVIDCIDKAMRGEL